VDCASGHSSADKKKAPVTGGGPGLFGFHYEGTKRQPGGGHRNADLVTQAIMFHPPLDVTFFPHPDGNPPLEMCGASVLPRWPFAVVTDFFAQDALTGESTGKARCATGLFSFSVSRFSSGYTGKVSSKRD